MPWLRWRAPGKNIDEAKTRDLYRQAFELDPTDPYAVSNYLVYEIIHQRDLAPASLMSPSLTAAIQRSRDQAEVGMNMPWAYYNLGIFQLLLGHPYESLTAYAQAIQLSASDWIIETSLRSLEKLSVVQEKLHGYEWVRRALMLGRAVKFQDGPSLAQLKGLATPDVSAIPTPVVIVAGGTADYVRVEDYRSLLLEGFQSFRGAIIGGGTTAGVSGLIGAVQAAYPQSIDTIGYVPATSPAWRRPGPSLPAGSFDRRGRISARSNRSSTGSTWFHPASRLNRSSSWGSTAGRSPRSNTASRSMLGASVGVIESSGREAARLFKDPYWGNSKALLCLSPDGKALESFLGSGK